MQKFRTLTVLLSSLLISYSCGVRRPAASVAPPPSYNVGGIQGEYINKYKDLAVSEMKRSGVPASITLAQGMLESDYGRSRLAVAANNHFGIKCNNGWQGQTIIHNDDRPDDCFRKYNNVRDSFQDHSNFLVSGSRYRDLFKLNPQDYKGWARGLRQAGYATDPTYADKLIKKIEEFELWRYDRGSAK